MEQAKAMLASWARSSVAGALAVWMTGNQIQKIWQWAWWQD
jgi:hypothetical protein